MLSHLRGYLGPVRRLLAWPFLRLRFSPAGVGLFGVAAALAAAVAARLGAFDFAFWVALLAVLTDLIDGEVARATNSTSPFGNYIDAIGDRTRECILLLGLVPMAPELVALALVGTCLTSFAKARCSLVRIMDNRDWPGVGDHPDRTLLILIAYLFAPTCVPALSLLVLVTWSCFVRRLNYARTIIEAADEEDLLPYLRR